MRVTLLGLFTAALVGCSGGGPATTDTSSSSLPTLESRVEFLQRYVRFRRGYEELVFHIRYRNNGSGVPAPSEWDIRLVARVPPGEIDLWVPAGADPEVTPDTSWLAEVPQAELAAGITEWYSGASRVVGVDRARRVVALRLWAE